MKSFLVFDIGCDHVNVRGSGKYIRSRNYSKLMAFLLFLVLYSIWLICPNYRVQTISYMPLSVRAYRESVVKNNRGQEVDGIR